MAQNPDDRSLELRRLLARFVDVCNTVAFAHSRGVLHRDLKPENIIIDEYGETLVVDWGLAKLSGREVEPLSGELSPHPVTPSELPFTVPGMKMGTAAFMSPEQAAGRISELDPRLTYTSRRHALLSADRKGPVRPPESVHR